MASTQVASAEKVFEPRVNIARKHSPDPCEMVCGCVFYVLVLAQLVLSILVLSTQNVAIPTIEFKTVTRMETVLDYDTYQEAEREVEDLEITFHCPEGMMMTTECCGGLFVYESTDCVSPALCDEMRACNAGCNARRLDDSNSTALWADGLQSLAEEKGFASPRRLHMRRAAARYLTAKTAVPENVWAFMEEHFYLPTVLFLCLLIAAAAWLVLLLKAATPVIWGTIGLDIALLLAVFVYFLAEHQEVCYPAIIFAVAGAIAVGVLYKKINAAGACLTQAMRALAANTRLFLVAFSVQLVWAGYFAFWISSMIGMFFNQKVIHGETGCQLTPSYPVGWLYLVWLVTYYWTCYFCQNVILCVLTVQVGGWYFNEDGSKGYWVKALQWSLTWLAGGNAVCAAILGATEYLRQIVEDKTKFILAILNPIDWIPLCLAACFQQCIATYTKFGMIGQAFSGENFCSSAEKTFNFLKTRLGSSVLTDFLGSRVMSWATYVLCVGLSFGAFAWAEDLHDMSIIQTAGVWGNVGIMLLMAFFCSRPFTSLVFIVLVENLFGSLLAMDDGVRSVFNMTFVAMFCGAIASFIMKFVSLVVVDTMNIIFFCFAVEKDSGASQERFTDLYDVIKNSVVTEGVPANAAQAAGGVVVGSTPATTLVPVQIPQGAQPGQTIEIPGPSGPMRCVIPEGSVPGQIIQVTVPVAPQPSPAPAASPAVVVVGNAMQGNRAETA